LTRENLRQSFGIENLNQGQLDDLLHRFNNLINVRTEAQQLPPPEGHKRGGYIKKKMMKNGGEYNLPDLGNDEEEPKYSKPFQPPAIPYAYPGTKGAKINRAIPLDRNSAITMSADVSKRQDQGGTNYNVNEFGGGYHHKVGPGMLGISGSHKPGTHENRVNLMYAIPMKQGGVVHMNEGGMPLPDDIQRAVTEGRITQNQAEYIHNSRLNPVPEHWGDHMSYQDRYNESLEPKPKYVPPTAQEIRMKEFLDKQDPMQQTNVDMNREQLRKHALQTQNPATFRSNPSRSGVSTQGGASVDIKQIMNPRNISYADGGNVSLDAMRYELLRKQ
jgi:hypothetical protein